MKNSDDSTRRLPLHLQILIAMAIGSAVGVLINPGEVPVNVPLVATLSQDASGVTLSETTDDDDALPVHSQTFSGESDFADSFPQLAGLLTPEAPVTVSISDASARMVHGLSSVTITWQRSHNGVPSVTTIQSPTVSRLPEFWQHVADSQPAGLAAKLITAAKCVGDLFLRLLKMVTVPLILTSLITGITGLGSQGRLGRMFGRTMTYYIVTSMLAITTGLVLVNLIQPGRGAILPGGGTALEPNSQSLVEIVYQQMERLLPANPFAAIANGEFLSIISFAILTGLFINAVGGDHGRRMREFFEAAFAVMMSMTAWVISLAPLGVAAFMVYATATQGFSIFQTLAWYMLTVLLALAVHAIIILPLILKLFSGRNPFVFARQMSPALLTAFSTASSNATLPLTMDSVENRAGVSNATSSFVLPLGATINMDGTALYEVVAVLFIAQATPGFDLSVAQQITVAFTALIASIGAAGIPHAGLVMMAIVLQAVGLPLEAQGIIIAVDRVLDMCRTSVNVWSDSCGCAVVETTNARGPLPN
ncbi:MAG: dicarboxylate/amino acid:cation symporter [Planctomycetaceae bacterium]